MPKKSTDTGLLNEFLSKPARPSRCVVCFEVDAELKKFIEGALRSNRGPVAIHSFLRSKGLWPYSPGPIRSHKEHMA